MSRRQRAREIRRGVKEVLSSPNSDTIAILMARNTVVTLRDLGFISHIEYSHLFRECNCHPAMSAR